MEKLFLKNPEIGDFEKVKELLKGFIADEKEFRRIVLACEEAFANIVFYSGAETVQVEIRSEDGQLTVTFRDDGREFDPTVVSTNKDFDELDTGGMGLSIVKDIADDLEYRRNGKENVLRVFFRRE